ncbi:hypothetical protein N7468_010696 [Penicillium chermesinum]|uniref:Uncharacterized protein n=1 Tax=Penicillium chermesinum TaxID=63820 RepID=A0A9W9N882_9EURO|nr:uncharacterized protein N7468_010696 [Penicillium chermesinum]KAJ5215017.1 hypothetical protein N7468_010696 [Penicillium chermesinum]
MDRIFSPQGSLEDSVTERWHRGLSLGTLAFQEHLHAAMDQCFLPVLGPVATVLVTTTAVSKGGNNGVPKCRISKAKIVDWQRITSKLSPELLSARCVGKDRSQKNTLWSSAKIHGLAMVPLGKEKGLHGTRLSSSSLGRTPSQKPNAGAERFGSSRWKKCRAPTILKGM